MTEFKFITHENNLATDIVYYAILDKNKPVYHVTWRGGFSCDIPQKQMETKLKNKKFEII